MNFSKTTTILVVDDDQICIQIAKDILQDAGADVHVAFNGKEALGAFDEHEFDMILVDYEMPVMNGLEFLKHMANVNDKKVPPIMMVSGSCNGDLEEIAKSYGAKDFLFKPFEKSEFLGRINAFCSLS